MRHASATAFCSGVKELKSEAWVGWVRRVSERRRGVRKVVIWGSILLCFGALLLVFIENGLVCWKGVLYCVFGFGDGVHANDCVMHKSIIANFDDFIIAIVPL